MMFMMNASCIQISEKLEHVKVLFQTKIILDQSWEYIIQHQWFCSISPLILTFWIKATHLCVYIKCLARSRSSLMFHWKICVSKHCPKIIISGHTFMKFIPLIRIWKCWKFSRHADQINFLLPTHLKCVFLEHWNVKKF